MLVAKQERKRMEAVTIVGAGGIGCAVGYALRSLGVEVTFVDTHAAKIRWGCANGVQVDNLPALPAKFVQFDDWSPPDDTLIILCTKCYDNAAVLRRLPASTMLVPIQNGFDQALANPGGVEGIASFISECLPGRTHTRITRRGKLHFGYRRTNLGSRSQTPFGNEGECERAKPMMMPASIRTLADCRQLLNGCFRIKVVADIMPYKYTKLMYNAAISPIAAAAGLDNGGLLSNKKARRLFFDLLLENYAILRDAGIPLGKVGPLHPDTVHRILRRRFIANAMAWAFYPTLRKTYCSMAGDLPRGRTEIDYYNQHLIDIAGDRPCPLNRRVVEVVHAMQAALTSPSLEVLNTFTGASKV
jgi:2-dehydropantoate 2-reductase